jgi:hypothetical protein
MQLKAILRGKLIVLNIYTIKGERLNFINDLRLPETRK